MGKIVVDRGLEEFEIVDKNDKLLGKFEMNPGDLEMIKRYEEVAEKFNHIGDDIDENESTEVILAKAEARVYELIDYLFNAEISNSFFSITSPFTPLKSGEYYIENVLNAIGKLIEDESGKRFKKVQAKMNKYTEKYRG